MLYGKTSSLANPTTSHVVPIMTIISFDVTSVVINIITNTICCFSVFCRDDPLILTIFFRFSGAPRLLKILQITTRSLPKKVYIFREISKIRQKRSTNRMGKKTQKNYDDFRQQNFHLLDKHFHCLYT